MLAKNTIFPGAFCSILMAGSGPAEIVDIPREYLASNATHIITAEVQKIEAVENVWGDHRVKSYTTTVQVRTVEKGKGLAAGEVIKIHYWTQERMDDQIVPDTAGYRGLPAAKEVVRVCLVNQGQTGAGVVTDGTFHVVFPNGFLGDASRPFAEVLPEPRDLPASHIVVGQVQKIGVKEDVRGQNRTKYFTAEVRVDKVEKGKGIAMGGTIQILYWTEQRVDEKGELTAHGYASVPVEGEELRLRLVSMGDAGAGIGKHKKFQVAFPDGFEKLKP